MVAYSGKAQPYLDAFAAAFFEAAEFRDWVLSGTQAAAEYTGADVLHDEQRAVRWAKKPTKQPFWANYWCGKDSKCTCRVDGSKGLESDAIFFLRNDAGRVLAVHLEFKHRGESFGFGQAQSYPLRAACFARTHAERKTVNAHDDWVCIVLCGSDAKVDPQLKHFDRAIFHEDVRERYQAFPK